MESFAYGIGCAVLYWGHFYHCGVAAVTTINPVYSWTRMTFFLSLIKPLQVESILGAQPFSASVHLRLSAEWMSDGWVHTGCPETGREYQWNVVFLFFFLFFSQVEAEKSHRCPETGFVSPIVVNLSLTCVELVCSPGWRSVWVGVCTSAIQLDLKGWM